MASNDGRAPSADEKIDDWELVDHDIEIRPVKRVSSPRIIIHGGAGNITRENLSCDSYKAYRSSMLKILGEGQSLLQKPGACALDVAVHVVALLEDDPLFNAGKGAVFARNGVNELEASIMVSSGYHKRATGCMLLKKVKNPIKLAKEMLTRGELSDGGGAQGHSQLSGESLESLAADWGLELVDPQYFFTQRRWDEHIRGLEQDRKEYSEAVDLSALPNLVVGSERMELEYLPQGTVGAVVCDETGVICVATSTGGLTNKLPGRIGDTPTIGAGFWAEEWQNKTSYGPAHGLGWQRSYAPPKGGKTWDPLAHESTTGQRPTRYAVGMSGTGNGDSFLRVNAVRTAAAIVQFSHSTVTLGQAINRVAGPGGVLQQSAGNRWGLTGEGEGGIIGVERVDGSARVVADFNCGGMFRAWIDDDGQTRFMVFRDEF